MYIIPLTALKPVIVCYGCSVDKATSQLLLETDWESILQICDLIRQGDTQ